MNNLIDILSTMRQHDSAGERNFIETYILPLNPTPMFNSKGEVLAYVVENTRGHSKVMWSCHVDTMHRNGKAGTSGDDRQDVWVDVDGVAFVGHECDCLGADDGAGMWLMFEMIKRDIAGTYVFHRGEEIGCWGSGGVAEEHTEWLKQFTHAIAFDRRGTTSIITHQRGERACSDKLANDLITLFDMGHKLDPTGVYTDTAEFMDIIPECVNISIGYDHEHSNHETLDTTYVLALRDAICALDWDKIELPVARDPSVRESMNNKYDDYEYTSSSWGVPKKSARKSTGDIMLDEFDIPTLEEIIEVTATDLGNWVIEADPMDVAYLLKDMAEQLVEIQYGHDYMTQEKNYA